MSYIQISLSTTFGAGFPDDPEEWKHLSALRGVLINEIKNRSDEYDQDDDDLIREWIDELSQRLRDCGFGVGGSQPLRLPGEKDFNAPRELFEHYRDYVRYLWWPLRDLLQATDKNYKQRTRYEQDW